MRIGAIYARVSSEQQREANTISSQTASLIEFVQEHDLEVPKQWVFEDDGYSGATLERPGLVRGTVPQKRARNTRPARSDVLYRPAIEALRCHPLPTS
jgi:hypothetical protein